MQPNGLTISKINVKYGDKQPNMRESILDDPGYFGPFHNDNFKLQLGDIQQINSHKMLMIKMDHVIFHLKKEQKKAQQKNW